MRIHEAIEKAGPGGKIKRAVATVTLVIPMMDDKGFRFEDGDEWPSFTPSSITATDWEVVEERIEVGDDITVKQHPCTNHDTVCEVVGEDDEKYHLRTRDIIYSYKDVDTRTLIRKGSKKHVFEGVEWREDGKSGFIHPRGPQLRKKLEPFVNDGKTYRMTLEEMK